MKKYALIVDDPILRDDLTLFFEKESLRKGDVVIIKRSQVKTRKNDRRAANKLFLKRGKSEKIRDRNVDNYEIRVDVVDEIGYRALEDDSGLSFYEGFSASIV